MSLRATRADIKQSDFVFPPPVGFFMGAKLARTITEVEYNWLCLNGKNYTGQAKIPPVTTDLGTGAKYRDVNWIDTEIDGGTEDGR